MPTVETPSTRRCASFQCKSGYRQNEQVGWSLNENNRINRIEKVHRFFTKRVAALWSVPYEKCLHVLKHHSLEYLRISNDLALYYKIINGKLDTDLSNICRLNSNSRAPRARDHVFKM